MARTGNFSMRIDESLKLALQATLDADTCKGGNTGGLSLLFHQLGVLYLGKQPPNGWKTDKEPLISGGGIQERANDISANVVDEYEKILINLEDKFSRRGIELDALDLDKLKDLKDWCTSLMHPRMKQHPSFEWHRGCNLIGRATVLLHEYESR